MKVQSQEAQTLIQHMKEILPVYIDALTKYRKPTLDEMQKYYDTFYNRDTLILDEPLFSDCNSICLNDKVEINLAFNEFMQCIARNVDCSNGLYHLSMELSNFYGRLRTIYAGFPMTLDFIAFALSPMLTTYTDSHLVYSGYTTDKILKRINEEGMHKHPITQLSMNSDAIKEIEESNFKQARCVCCRQFYPFSRLIFATNNYTFGVCESCRDLLSAATEHERPVTKDTSFFSDTLDNTKIDESNCTHKSLADYFAK